MRIFSHLNETEELTDAVRARAGGSFIRLADGICHYELGGQRRAQCIILVHGFSVPYFIWDPTFDFLTQSGFRVLRYDLFGRGYSDRPRLRYDIELFVRQLRDLLDALDIREPVHLAGLSMGGPISAAFVDKYPAHVKSLTLIDPAGVQAVRFSAWLKSIQTRIAREWKFGQSNELGSLLKRIASDFFDPEMVGRLSEHYLPQMKIKGFKRALLSTIRNGMLGSFLETYQRVGQLHKPTLLIWGKNDATVPFTHSEILCAAIPHAQLHAIEHCGHIPHYEKPEEVNGIFYRFVRSNA